MALKGSKLTLEHRERIASAIKERHRLGLQPKVERCPVCESFIGKNHDCNEIKQKQSQAKLDNPTMYWLGKQRDENTRKAISNAQINREHSKGKDSPTWMGGCSDWYHKEARKIMENKIGRKLESKEIVHHINQDWKDNRIENLQIVSRSEHMKIHDPMKWRSK